jgi:hypothetical protein
VTSTDANEAEVIVPVKVTTSWSVAPIDDAGVKLIVGVIAALIADELAVIPVPVIDMAVIAAWVETGAITNPEDTTTTVARARVAALRALLKAIKKLGLRIIKSANIN